MASSETQDHQVDDDSGSESSIVRNGSVISTVPDRHGFLGGNQYSTDAKQSISPVVMLRREQKWLHMFRHWEQFMERNYKLVRDRCRKGIPSSVRPRAWLFLCGGKMVLDKSNNLYHNLKQQKGDARWIDDIKKDLHRQFPYHEMFVEEEGNGQKDLFDVLKAYSIRNKSVGYSQAQAPIAAFLLMHMPAEQAFWCLVSICDNYLVGYYSPGMETLQLDGDILFGLLKKVAPNVYKHLKKQKVDPILYMTEWFLCVFTRTLPWDSILRVWDMFLCEGVKVVFKVALILLKFSLGQTGIMKRCPTMYETLEVLRNPPQEIMEEKFLVAQMLRINLTEEDFAREHKRQLLKRQAAAAANEKKNRQQK